ncbi:uncharacterized protein LOC121248431 isoform X1 [Juglans microcarpa x Juglans regia]|uniref:uncharacterized protein LOC121248431 isoform X1 n=1 Tax=Juglans microcarpa x Juglans regia TaxID=2249226 RepID=UPI001B7DBDC5|nr:uncharacterized protein LOC121248431 isoform X1 [Juglans microcarpa x Juglans regia]
MNDQGSDDLPPGWTVEVKVRKNGKRDKVVVEKAIAEGLPPGWIKEVRVTKKGHKIRKDPLYTDPISGYVFRSMKDVSRYLETGELGRLAFKPKDKVSIGVELECDNTSSHDVAKKQKLALSIPGKQIICDQSPKLNDMAKDEQIPKSACTEKCLPLPEHTSDQSGRLDIHLSSSNLPEAKVSEQIKGKNNSNESLFVSAPAVGFLPDNQSLRNEGTIHEVGKAQLGMRKPKNKKEYNLPRRASKRLAGLDIDPTPELKTSQARRIVVKQSGEAGASTPPCCSPGSLAPWESQQPTQLEGELEAESNVDSSKSTKVLESTNRTHSYADLTTPVEHTGKAQREHKDEQKQQSSTASPVRNAAILEEHAGKVEKGKENNEKPDIPIELPSMDLWSDPCIQFAIKTLTGVGVDSPKSTEMSAISINSRHATGDLATLAFPEQTKVEAKVKGDMKQGCPVVLPFQNLATPKQHAWKVENKFSDYEKPGSPLNMTSCDSWMDPCIDFAIKTLTGAIPVDCVLDIHNSFQSQQSSSQTQTSSGLTSSNVAFNNSCQTDFFCQQFDTMEKPDYRHQALLDPVLLQTGHAGLQNSGTTVLHQPSEGRGSRGNRCQ